MDDFTYQKIMSATSLVDIFGIPPVDVDSEVFFKKQYRFMATCIHPDKSLNDIERIKRNHAFSKLNEMYQLYKNISCKNENNSLGIIETHTDVWEFLENFGGTKFISYYKGHIRNKKTNDTKKAWFKIPDKHSLSNMLKNEVDVIKKIKNLSVPEILSEIYIDNKQCVAYGFNNGTWLNSWGSAKYISDEHILWMLDRTLHSIGNLHYNKIIHGYISPSSLYVVPENHNIILGDLTFAIVEANKQDKKYIGKNDFTPSCVNKDTIPHPKYDIYSLGKTFEHIMDINNSDQRLVDFIKDMLLLHDNADAWILWQKLKKLRKTIRGFESEFLEFKI